MLNKILTYFQKKYKPERASIEAVCYMLDLSLAHGYNAIDWKGW